MANPSSYTPSLTDRATYRGDLHPCQESRGCVRMEASRQRSFRCTPRRSKCTMRSGLPVSTWCLSGCRFRRVAQQFPGFCSGSLRPSR